MPVVVCGCVCVVAYACAWLPVVACVAACLRVCVCLPRDTNGFSSVFPVCQASGAATPKKMEARTSRVTIINGVTTADVG